MKNYIWIILSGLIVLTSCNRNADDFYPYDDEEFYDDIDDNGGDDDFDNNSGGEGELTLYKVNGDNLEFVKDYNIESNLQSFQDDKGKHQKMWRFALAIDAANNLNSIDFSDFFTFVTIHEFGHVLTLNDEQVNAGGGAGSCSNYFTGEGCSTRTSYINELYKIGWSDIINSHNENNPDATYNKYRDRFVSDYAATNPGEDIAEVFSFFVINNSAPTGNTIADQKIKMMYNYPELVKLRDDIRSSGNVSRMNAKSTSKAMNAFKIKCKRGCKHEVF